MKQLQGRMFSVVLGLAWAVASSSAGAQWQWLDAQGRKIFSDTAPPPSVPENRILRGGDGRPYIPSGQAAVTEAPAPSYGFHEYKPEPSASPKPQAAAVKKPSKTPKELEEEKKAEAERLAKAAEAKRKEEERKAANCKVIRSNQAALDSGRRLSSFNDKGERVVMNDAERANERMRTQELLRENDCN